MGIDSRDVAAFILAGGKSTRMGTDKALVPLQGRTLLARALELARSVTDDIHVVGDPGRFASYASVVEDIYRDCGPLAGIHAALRVSQKELNLILAVDLPFVSRALLQFLLDRARASRSALVTVVRSTAGWQPLCAVYRRDFADAAEDALRSGHCKIDALFHPSCTQVIAEEQFLAAGFSASVFRNLNTSEELSSAEQGQPERSG